MPLLAIILTGFCSTVAQIVVLRELWVLFLGNELASGIVFAVWLLWNAVGNFCAARWLAFRKSGIRTIAIVLSAMALMLPAALFLIRGAGLLWHLPSGELVPLGHMLSIALTATGLICPLGGVLFSLCWALQRCADPHRSTFGPLAIYWGEALGATLGGVAFYFVFLEHFSALNTVWLTSALVLFLSGGMLRPWRPSHGGRIARLIWLAGLAALLVVAINAPFLERMSRRWQWGPGVVAVTDSPYANIALIKRAGQLSVFSNGLWFFSFPDRLTTEMAAHPVLLQHPAPVDILLLGGALAGHLEQILKHPQVRRIDAATSDPRRVEFMAEFMPESIGRHFEHPAVTLHPVDAGTYVRHCSTRYDIVLLNCGDPLSAGMNRFYTLEFFHAVRRVLKAGGIFSFAVSGGQDMLGPLQGRFLSSLRQTLGEIFPQTLTLPGDQTRFMATGEKGRLWRDHRQLAERMRSRGLELDYLNADTLAEAFNPFRWQHFESFWTALGDVPLNRDFKPVCYFHSLILWGSQWHPVLQRLLTAWLDVHPSVVWLALGLGGGLLVLFFWTGPRRFKTALSLCILVSGATEMVTQIVLLLGLQILVGVMYRQLALMIALYMAGLGLGAGVVGLRGVGIGSPEMWRRRFVGVQFIFCLFPLVLMLVFEGLHGGPGEGWGGAAIGWIFALISLAAGLLGGVHFALAVRIMAGSRSAPVGVGGGLHALDLVGAAGGTLITSLFILPVLGVMATLGLLSAIAFIGLLTLLRQP